MMMHPMPLAEVAVVGLAEASREVATAQSRVAERERSTYDCEHIAAQRNAHADNDHWKEAADAARQKADAERHAESSQAAQQEAEQNLRMAQLEVTRLKVRQFACSIVLPWCKVLQVLVDVLQLRTWSPSMLSALLLPMNTTA